MFFPGQYLCDGLDHSGNVRPAATHLRIAETEANRRVTLHFCYECAAEWDNDVEYFAERPNTRLESDAADGAAQPR